MVTSPTALGEEQLDRALKALASAPRREALRFLAGKTCGRDACCVDDVCACELSEHLGLAASTVSHHMGILRDAGLVVARKRGTWVHYAVRGDVLDAVADAVRRL